MSKLEYTDNLMLSRQLPLKSVALILAGGRGTRLKDLTTIRAKPATGEIPSQQKSKRKIADEKGFLGQRTQHLAKCICTVNRRGIAAE
jgi:hypothetical protein